MHNTIKMNNNTIIPYASFAEKWINDTITDDEVKIIKDKVFELLPEWKNNKITVINAPNNSFNKFMIITYDFDQFIWLSKQNEFTVENCSHKKYLPNFNVEEGFYSNKNKSLTVGFGIFTGLRYVLIVNKKNEKHLIQYDVKFFKFNEDYMEAKKYIEQHNNFSSDFNENFRNYYLFTDDKFEYRVDDWYYANKYEEYEKLGVLSDYTIDVPSRWFSAITGERVNETETIELFYEDEIILYKDFVKIIDSV